MSYIDALIDKASFYEVSVNKNQSGQEVKQESLLYSEIPCRFAVQGSFPVLESNITEFENVLNKYTLQTIASYSGGKRGDRVVINDQDYIITNKKEIKGRSSTINFILYYLQERQ